MKLSSLFFLIFVPGAWPHERSDVGHSFEKLNFLSFSLRGYIFKNCPSQFLSHWELVEPVFCSEELSFLPYKTKTKAWFSVLDRKIQNLTISLYFKNYLLIIVSTTYLPLIMQVIIVFLIFIPGAWPHERSNWGQGFCWRGGWRQWQWHIWLSFR